MLLYMVSLFFLLALPVRAGTIAFQKIQSFPEKALPMRAELIGRHKLCAGTGHLRDARRNHGLFFLSGIC